MSKNNTHEYENCPCGGRRIKGQSAASETRQTDGSETGNRTLPSATVSIDRELASTHWDDCWRKHHGCAVAMIERLSAVTETAPIQSNGPHGE